MPLDLNLLYFAPCDLHEGIGGSARLENMTSVFQELGINTHLVSYITKDKFQVKHEKINNLLSMTKVYVQKAYPKLLKVLALLLILLYGLKYARKSEIIFAHAPGIMTGFPAMILAKLFNKPLIIDHMDVKDPDTPRFIYNVVLRNSTVVFAISHYLENEVKRKHKRNAIHVPIFIDTNDFQRDLLEGKKVRGRLGIGDKDILIGYAGSFWYVEGVSFLLKAFRNLIMKHKNIRLIVIGRMNEDSENLPLLIEELSLGEKAILVPKQPRRLIPDYLSACNILCSPKIDCEINRAANPVKVIEYLSMSLPVVCSAVGGIVDAIKDKFNGLLVKPGDVKDLEEKLEWILLNPEKAKELGKNGRKTVIENYSYKAIKDKIKQKMIKIRTHLRRIRNDMRILQVTNFFKPSWEAGGPTRAVYEFSKELVKREHEVTVYTTDGFKRRLAVETNTPIDVDGMVTYYFKNISRYLPGKVSPIPYCAAKVAKNEIMKFDVIHIHGLTMLGFMVHYYARKYEIPYVLQGHGSLFFKMRGRVSFSPNGSISIRKKNLIGRTRNSLFERPTLRNASKVVALTKAEAEQCKKLDVGEDRIEIIPNGIDIAEYDNLPEKGRFRRKYRISDDEKVVLYLGRIHLIKGIHMLVKAFSGLLKELDAVRLVIVGPDDGFLSTLKRYTQSLEIGDKILFTGPLFERDRLAAYVAADVYVLPSIYETFPKTVLEAWACGTPVIVTDRCGIADIVNKVGFVVKYDNKQLQKAIFNILNEKELRNKFETEGKKLVRDKFNLSCIMGKIEALYEELVSYHL